jgi:hypothetical protein
VCPKDIDVFAKAGHIYIFSIYLNNSYELRKKERPTSEELLEYETPLSSFAPPTSQSPLELKQFREAATIDEHTFSLLEKKRVAISVPGQLSNFSRSRFAVREQTCRSVPPTPNRVIIRAIPKQASESRAG